jgi:ribosome recycling factor
MSVREIRRAFRNVKLEIKNARKDGKITAEERTDIAKEVKELFVEAIEFLDASAETIEEFKEWLDQRF